MIARGDRLRALEAMETELEGRWTMELWGGGGGRDETRVSGRLDDCEGRNASVVEMM